MQKELVKRYENFGLGSTCGKSLNYAHTLFYNHVSEIFITCESISSLDSDGFGSGLFSCRYPFTCSKRWFMMPLWFWYGRDNFASQKHFWFQCCWEHKICECVLMNGLKSMDACWSSRCKQGWSIKDDHHVSMCVQASKGVKAGMRVAILSRNSVEYLRFCFGFVTPVTGKVLLLGPVVNWHLRAYMWGAALCRLMAIGAQSVNLNWRWASPSGWAFSVSAWRHVYLRDWFLLL